MQVEYKTEKGNLLFVKAPDDARDFEIYKRNNGKMMFDYFVKSSCVCVELAHGNWQLIGPTSEVSEEQAKMMVDCVDALHDLYRDYEPSKFVNYNNALSSLKSLMQHLQVYEVNPLGEYPKIINHRRLPVSMVQRKKERWHKANQTVGKWILLFKNHEQNNI